MDTLDLKKVLKSLGAAKLSELIGVTRLEAICSIMKNRVTESQLAEILLARHGTQILADKKVREKILFSLPRKVIAYLVHEDSESLLTESDLGKLKNVRWSRNSTLTQRLLSLFGFDVEYMPPIKPKVESQEIIECETILYPYQKRVKDKFTKSLIFGDKRLLLHMPTGAGKTRTVIEGLVDFWRAQGDSKGFMIWLADSEELCTQAEETFAKLWKVRGDRPINLIRMWGNHKIDDLNEKGGLIIAGLQKLHRMRTSPSDADFKLINEINNRSRLVVVDEAHKSIAPTYKATIEFICDLDKTRLIGLTATPGRTDEGQIADLVEFYGNKKITLTNDNDKEVKDPIAYLQEREYLSQISRKKVPTDITVDLTSEERKSVSDFFEIPSRILLELSKNDQRNALIVQEIVFLHETDHQIIVFACSVEHAHLVSELLILRGIRARCIDGSTSSFDRSRYIEAFKKGETRVLVNYGVLTTGFDAPNTNAVMITRPTGSLVLYSQMIGRGIRGPKMGGTPDCILVDIEDNLIGYPSEKQAFNFFDNYWGQHNA